MGCTYVAPPPSEARGSSASPIGSGWTVRVVGPAALHHGAQILAQLLERGASHVPPAVVDPVDREIGQQRERVGQGDQAVAEARTAASLGYHAGLLSLAAFKGTGEDEMVAHCAAVAREIPVVGFYLQTAVGGVPLPVSFWRRFAAIDNVIAIKMAPFNRYRTLDVIRGVVEAKAEDRITLYTGNDDHIVLDLLCPFDVRRGGETVRVRVRGGLLGHWSVWTKAAVDLMERLHRAVEADDIDLDLLALDSRVTDCNGAVFDVANDFHGVIAGCHEVLRRQGLLEGIWCLDTKETLGRGQADELTRVANAHPDLTDDAFVRANLQRWLS